MKIVHIESGLGNQMLSYCEYIALKTLHPNEEIYIETIVFDIPQCNEVIRQWNGYELERVFGVQAPNVRQLFTPSQWESIMEELQTSAFWNKNWNYPIYITKAFRNAGLDLRNIRGDFELSTATHNVNMKESLKPTLRQKLIDSQAGDYLKRTYRTLLSKRFISRGNRFSQIFYEGTDNIFTGQWLALRRYGNGLERIEKQVRETFKFPAFTDRSNIDMANLLDQCTSVAIHARRGDMLGCNGYCYKHGYFRRAVKHIKRRVPNPVFVFFCDPGSVEWCKQNSSIFGLDFRKDKVLFVDWNKGEESFRDMQLMAHCKHAIITNSSFGWWGAFFITNPDKITISPKQEIATNTTYHC